MCCAQELKIHREAMKKLGKKRKVHARPLMLALPSMTTKQEQVRLYQVLDRL